VRTIAASSAVANVTEPLLWCMSREEVREREGEEEC
jgi:hypothetical protein